MRKFIQYYLGLHKYFSSIRLFQLYASLMFVGMSLVTIWNVFMVYLSNRISEKPWGQIMSHVVSLSFSVRFSTIHIFLISHWPIHIFVMLVRPIYIFVISVWPIHIFAISVCPIYIFVISVWSIHIFAMFDSSIAHICIYQCQFDLT